MRTMLVFLLLASPCLANESRSIPLASIWAYDMPGTKRIQDLEDANQQQLTQEERQANKLPTDLIRQALKPSDYSRISAKTAFAVVGTGKEALKNAALAFATGVRPDSHSEETDLSLVFFSHTSGAAYVHLVSVEVEKRLIKVTFRFVTHTSYNTKTATYDSSEHFALIPLGKLSEGKMKIEIVQAQTVGVEGHPSKLPTTEIDKIICRSGSFGILSKGE